MICPCGCDHWLHVAAGLQGVAGMLVNLEAAQAPPTRAGLAKLEEQLQKLQGLLERQKAKIAD